MHGSGAGEAGHAKATAEEEGAEAHIVFLWENERRET
jgi:hypothetical protein